VLLDRTATASEVNGWVAHLPGMGRQGVALGFLRSTEFRRDEFEGYYNVLLHRPDNPNGTDPASLNGWVLCGLDVRGVRVGFETSPEFFVNG
jgi:hypothetical protein